MLLRREGLAVPDIAGRLGVTYQVVSNYFRRQGWKLQEQRPTWERPEAAPLTEEQIVHWAQDHYAAEGRYPRATATEIPGSSGETWAGLDTALRRGLRGLGRGSNSSLVSNSNID